MLHIKSLLILSTSCFVVCVHHLSPRISIVFSLLSSLPNSSMSQASNVFMSNASRSPLYGPQSPTTLYIVVPHGHIFLATSSSSRLLAYLFFLIRPDPLLYPKSQFRLFGVVHWAVRLRFHSNIILQPPGYLRACPLSQFLLALAFLLLVLHFLLLSCTRQTSLQTVSVSSWSPTISFYIVSTDCVLSLPIPALAFWMHSPIPQYQLWLVTSFLAYFLLYFAIATF